VRGEIALNWACVVARSVAEPLQCAIPAVANAINGVDASGYIEVTPYRDTESESYCERPKPRRI
jgi:hypothetical protein